MVGDGLVVSLSSILIGLYAGLLRGGLVRNIGSTRIQWWGMLVVGVAVPVLVNRTDPARGVALVVLSLVALIAFAMRNRALTGMSIVAVGLCANLGVVLLNDGMPVRREALVASGLASADEVDRVEIAGVQRLEREGDRLVFLADVIPLAETNQVLSFGDLIILAGLADVAANLLLVRRRETAGAAGGCDGGDRSSSMRPPRRTLPVSEQTPVAARERAIPDFEPIRLVVEEPEHVLVGIGAAPPRS